MRPFRFKKIFSLISEIKRNWIRFTCVSLVHYKFHLYFSLLFAYFRFKFFASLHFSNFRFETKQSEAEFKYIFSLFFALNFLLRFDFVIFVSKRNEEENFFASKEAKPFTFSSQFSFRIKLSPNFRFT